uniref:Torsin-1A-interacting protein 1/2 AAA+ activator domain-containing protein n=2 Tax=Oryzias latipes TaxID=8090 RepID=A0A3B3HE07_ORYLA
MVCPPDHHHPRWIPLERSLLLLLHRRFLVKHEEYYFCKGSEMDSSLSKSQDQVHPRRSKRLKPEKDVSYEATPRGPLKRTKRKFDQCSSTKVVNGDGDLENGLEDDESPSKQRRQDAVGADGDEVKDIEMDKQESDEEMEKMEDQETKSVEESKHVQNLNVPKTIKGTSGGRILYPHVELGRRCRPGHIPEENSIPLNLKEETFSKTKNKTAPAPPTKSPAQVPASDVRWAVKVSSMEEYKRKMEAKAKSSDDPRVSRWVRQPEEAHTKRPQARSIPTRGGNAPPLNKEKKKPTVLQGSFGDSRPGFAWYLWRLTFLVLLSSAALLAFNILPALRPTASGGEPGPTAEKLGTFADQLSLLQTRFPSQRPELWRMSKIHLEKHLKTGRPSEPVSMILTAGVGAERTLLCLARGFAASFSSTLDASFLLIDGASKAAQNSDAVKLDIDKQLQAAFEGDQPTAVIHRFEQLPPGSTIIFYRYCDHENAAYKRAFLLFTVLLPQDDIGPELSLKEVEEAVQNFVQEKLVGSGGQTAFDKMDIDKFSGLWSRISHLVLPVVSEPAAGQQGCP